MKWKKRLGGALLTGAITATMLSTGALAGDRLGNYERDNTYKDHMPSYSTDYVLVKETTYDLETNQVARYAVYDNDANGNAVKKTYHYNAIHVWDTEYEEVVVFCYDESRRISGKMVYLDDELYARAQYTRDAVGNIVQERVEEGLTWDNPVTTEYEHIYDSHNQVISTTVHYDGEQPTTTNRINTYDENGNLMKEDWYNDKGVYDSISYEYDDNNRIIQSVRSMSGDDPYVMQSFTYDSNGNEATYTLSGEYTVYEYKKLSEITPIDPIPFDPTPVDPKPHTPVYEVFNDISDSAWYTDAVQYVYDEGIMMGMNENTFAPNASMTRAMVAQILYAQAGSPEVSGDMPFTDVPADKWYHNAILWANQNDVVVGTGDNRFAPNDNITRQEYAAILYRYEKSPSVSGSLNFQDANTVSGWATDAMLWATQNGIVSGTINNGITMLDPKGTATRAQSAMILMNYLTR